MDYIIGWAFVIYLLYRAHENPPRKFGVNDLTYGPTPLGLKIVLYGVAGFVSFILISRL